MVIKQRKQTPPNMLYNKFYYILATDVWKKWPISTNLMAEICERVDDEIYLLTYNISEPLCYNLIND